jgi:hypothetical protein
MGLLDFFRRRGASAPGSSDANAGGAEAPPEERAHGVGVPAGATAEGPPVGVADPGSITGEDADEVVAQDEGDEVARP